MFFTMQSVRTKNFALLVAGDADPFLHLIEIFGEGAAAGGGQAIFGARDSSLEKFDAGNVLRLFELSGVDAQVAVGGFEDAFEIVEAERIVGGKGADDAEADALVNQAIEFGKFRSVRRMLASFFACVRSSMIVRVIVKPGLGLGVLAV